MVAAVTVCSGFPLLFCASPTQQAVSCGCGEALLRLPAEEQEQMVLSLRPRNLPLPQISQGLDADLCVSCSFMLHQTWFRFIQRVEGIMK